MKKFAFLISSVFTIFTAPLATAENYYFWCQAASGNLPLNTGSYWYDSTYTTPFTGSLTFTSLDNLTREKSLGGGYQFSVGATFDLNSFTNTGTGLSNNLVIYNSVTDTVSTINTVTQSGDKALVIRKRATANTFNLTVKNTEVSNHYLYYGHVNDKEYLTNLSLTDSVNVSNGSYLMLYALKGTIAAPVLIESSNMIVGIGNYSNYGGTEGDITFNDTITATKSATGNGPKIYFGQKRGTSPVVLDYLNKLTLSKALTISDGELGFNANKVTTDLISATNTKIYMGVGRDTAQTSDYKIKKLDFSGTLTTHNVMIGAGSITLGVYSPTEIVDSLILGDFNYENTVAVDAAIFWNLKEFKVKASEFTGATGTFNYNSNHYNYRAYIFADKVDIDNFNLSKDDASTEMDIVHFLRTSATITGSQFKVGKYVGNERSRLRVGSLYQGTAWYFNNKYDSIDIADLQSHGEEVFLWANTINIGKFDLKASAGAALNTVFGNNASAANTVVIGQDALSTSIMDGMNAATKLTMRSNSITVNGSLTVKDGAHLLVDSPSLTNFTAKDLIVDSTNASTFLFSNNNQNTTEIPNSATIFNKLDVDSITLQNLGIDKVQLVNLNANQGSTVGTITIKSESATNKGVDINSYKTVAITNFNVENGKYNHLNLYDSALTLNHIKVSQAMRANVILDGNSSYTGNTITVGYSSWLYFSGSSGSVKNVTVDSVTINKAVGDYIADNTYLSFNENARLKVNNNFVNNNTTSQCGFLFAGGLEVVGVLENNGSANFVAGVSTSGEFKTFDYSIGALKGSSGGRIGTSPVYSNGAFNLTFNGTSDLNSSAVYKGAIYDVEDNDSQTIIDGYGTTRQVRLIIDSADGTLVQYLVGRNSIRGDTEIISGTLIATTKNNTQAAGLGFSKVIVNGGKFGACGANETVAVGEVKMKSLEWSQGQFLFDLDGENADKFIIEGVFSKGAGAMGKLEFLFSGAVQEGYDYNIISFGGTDFSETDLEGYLTGYDATFTFDHTNGNLWVSFTAIPEPSTYALILGLASLLIIAYKRKKR